MRFTVKDYDKNALEQVTFEYSKAGENDFKVGPVRNRNELSNSSFGTNVDWDVSNVPDGTYELRLKVSCGVNTAYTSRIRGTIDRKGPLVLGKPKPNDHNYAKGDVISVAFSEKLDCAALNNADVTIARLVQQKEIRAKLSCFNNEVSIVPELDLSTIDGEPLRVTIRNVRDVYGNAIAAPLSWEFFVGGDVASQDFDRDGVIDALDLCQGFNDKIDTDLDGIPDGCDLCKDKTNAGINFDGIDDAIHIKNPVDTNFTIEAWIKTTATSPSGSAAYEGNGLIWSDLGGPANDFTIGILNNKLAFFDGDGNIATNVYD